MRKLATTRSPSRSWSRRAAGTPHTQRGAHTGAHPGRRDRAPRPASAPAATLAPTTLRVLVHQNPPFTDYMAKFNAAFEERHPGVTVDMAIEAPNLLATTTQTRLAAGDVDVVDIFAFDTAVQPYMKNVTPPIWQTLADEGQLLDITERAVRPELRPERDQATPGRTTARSTRSTSPGSGSPACTSTRTCSARTASPCPTTWSELVAACQAFDGEEHPVHDRRRRRRLADLRDRLRHPRLVVPGPGRLRRGPLDRQHQVQRRGEPRDVGEAPDHGPGHDRGRCLRHRRRRCPGPLRQRRGRDAVRLHVAGAGDRGRRARRSSGRSSTSRAATTPTTTSTCSASTTRAGRSPPTRRTRKPRSRTSPSSPSRPPTRSSSRRSGRSRRSPPRPSTRALGKAIAPSLENFRIGWERYWIAPQGAGQFATPFATFFKPFGEFDTAQQAADAAQADLQAGLDAGR